MFSKCVSSFTSLFLSSCDLYLLLIYTLIQFILFHFLFAFFPFSLLFFWKNSFCSIFHFFLVWDQVCCACLRDILVRSGSCHLARHLCMVGCRASSCTHILSFGWETESVSEWTRVVSHVHVSGHLCIYSWIFLHLFLFTLLFCHFLQFSPVFFKFPYIPVFFQKNFSTVLLSHARQWSLPLKRWPTSSN